MELLSLARDVLDAQPFSRLLGTRLTECSPGVACLEIDIDDRHRQQYGLVHGGVMAYLADNAVSFAAGSVLGPSLVSTGLTLELLGNAREGTLRAVGRVAVCSDGMASVEVEILAVRPDSTATLCARGAGNAASTEPR